MVPLPVYLTHKNRSHLSPSSPLFQLIKLKTSAKLISAIDNHTGSFNRIKERPDSDAVVVRPGELFLDVNLNAGDADI